MSPGEPQQGGEALTENLKEGKANMSKDEEDGSAGEHRRRAAEHEEHGRRAVEKIEAAFQTFRDELTNAMEDKMDRLSLVERRRRKEPEPERVYALMQSDGVVRVVDIFKDVRSALQAAEDLMAKEPHVIWRHDRPGYWRGEAGAHVEIKEFEVK